MVLTRIGKRRNSSLSSSSTPTKKRKSPRKRYGPFGPYSSADRKLDGMTRKEATKFNDERISKALHELAGKPRVTRHSIRTKHRMSKPRLHVGRPTINRTDAGCWFQWVCQFFPNNAAFN
jgi:hypothetical protein